MSVTVNESNVVELLMDSKLAISYYESQMDSIVHVFDFNPNNKAFLQFSRASTAENDSDDHREVLFSKHADYIDTFHKDNQFYYADRPIRAFTRYTRNSTIDRWHLYWPNTSYCLYSCYVDEKTTTTTIVPVNTVCFSEKEVWMDDGTRVRVGYSGSGWTNNQFRGKRVTTFVWNIQNVFLKARSNAFMYGYVQIGNNSSFKAINRSGMYSYGNLLLKFNGYYVGRDENEGVSGPMCKLETAEEFEEHIYQMYGRRAMVPCDLRDLFSTVYMTGHYTAEEGDNLASFSVWKMIGCTNTSNHRVYPGYLLLNISTSGERSLNLLNRLIQNVELELLKQEQCDRLFISILTVPSHELQLHQSITRFILTNRNNDPTNFPLCDNSLCLMVLNVQDQSKPATVALYPGDVVASHEPDNNTAVKGRFFYDPRDCGNKPMYHSNTEVQSRL